MPENDQHRLLGSSEDTERDVEAHGSEIIASVNGGGGSGGSSGKGFRDLLKLSGHHRHSFKRLDRERDHHDDSNINSNPRDSHSDFDLHSFDSSGDELADSAPPEWALLLLGCLLGLATGLLVAAFNKGVCQFSIFYNVLVFWFLTCLCDLYAEQVVFCLFFVFVVVVLKINVCEC
jgi:hypothetical protein